MTPTEANECMSRRELVLLPSGESGKVVRVETELPRGRVTVTVWNQSGQFCQYDVDELRRAKGIRMTNDARIDQTGEF